MTTGGGSFAHLSFHVGADWRVGWHACADGRPILSVDAGQSAVSITITDRDADTAAVEFARALVREAQAFAAQVERLHAGQPADAGDDNTKAADSNAA